MVKLAAHNTAWIGCLHSTPAKLDAYSGHIARSFQRKDREMNKWYSGAGFVDPKARAEAIADFMMLPGGTAEIQKAQAELESRVEDLDVKRLDVWDTLRDYAYDVDLAEKAIRAAVIAGLI